MTSKNKLNIEDITNLIISESYYVFPDTVLTICALTLKNGFVVTGESACVDKQNYNQSIGEHIAKQNAISKIWMLESYLLKEKNYNNEKFEVK